MAYEPVMDWKSPCNVAGEHVFKIRATFGSSSAVTYRSKDATIEKTTTTTFTVRLPKAYAEITDFSFGWQSATPLDVSITTNSVATDGTLVLTTSSTPTDGDKLFITLGVSCDVLNDRFTG